MQENDNCVRLNKYIADCGVTSRRKADLLIEHKKVMVNQSIITQPGTKIDLIKDIVTIDGVNILPEKQKVYFMLNKPLGYVTTVKDQFSRPTVMDLIKTNYRIFPIGRLDYNTSGLLILTNDGELANKIMHPKFKVEKTYIARFKGIIKNDEIEKLRNGIRIEDYTTYPAKITVLSICGNTTTLSITINEGKNRQVRKMIAAVGYKINSLERISLGELKLGDLKISKWRSLDEKEIRYLKNIE